MKHCLKCNSLMPEDAVRCIHCGFELQKASVLSAGVQPSATVKAPSTRQARMKVKALRLAAYLLIAHFLIVAAVSFRSTPNYSTLATLLFLLVSSVGVLFSPRRRGWLAVLGYAIVVFGNQALGSWALLSNPTTPLAIKVTTLVFLVLVDSLAIAALVFVFRPSNFAAFAASVPGAGQTQPK